MYKYKQTTDVEVGDLVVWTELPSSVTNRINNKVYRATGKTTTHNPIIIDETGSEKMYGKAHGFKILQTKPADQAVVGDYMYRITFDTSTFPKHSVIKITRTGNERLGYSEELGVALDEVIVIAQAESEVKYPYFIQAKGSEYICKVLEKEKYTYIHTWEEGGCNKIWNIQPPTGEPCDFTIQPEVFDIDWWQQRFEAGLPVYVRDRNEGIAKCDLLPPKSWDTDCTFGMTYSSLAQQEPISYEIQPLGSTTDCSLQPTTKEQPMKLQQLLDAIFGVSDYEAKPKFIVTVFNNDKEVGTTTAESVEEIQQTIQSDTRLWECKLVAYKIHSELQTQVPVTITKFKKESNA